MKVAIIGGGLAGIVCAIQLERLGVTPDIFERNNDLAEPYRHVGAALQIILRPIKDPLEHLDKAYGIGFRPSGLVKKVIHKSSSVCTTITGDLGYFLHRGAIRDSIDNQLAQSLKSRIHLKKEADFRKLRNQYDYVVVASGHPFEAKQLGIWRDIIHMTIKGAVISGDFETDSFTVWINKDFCRSGYAYLAPFNKKEATLALAVNDIKPDEIGQYWDHFVKSENINHKIIECFTRVHYAGLAYPHRVENIFFIGNAAGVLDPLLGFGVFPTVVTASEAAKAIVNNTDYESGIKSVVKLNRKLLEFRKTFNMLDNRGYDWMLRLLGLPGANSLIYKTGMNAINIGYTALKPLNALLHIGKK